MKRVACLLLVFLTGAIWAAEKPAPTLPKELHLTNGAVLKNVSLIRWENDRVVLKHTGGTAGIFFRHIAEPDRAATLAAKEAAGTPDPALAAATPGKTKAFRGQVFVATMGGKNYKLGDVKVMAFEGNVLSQFETNANTVALPKPLAAAVTDADGRWSLSVPAEIPVFFFAEGGRIVGRNAENYQWRVPEKTIADRESVLLSNANMAGRRFMVTVNEN